MLLLLLGCWYPPPAVGEETALERLFWLLDDFPKMSQGCFVIDEHERLCRDGGLAVAAMDSALFESLPLFTLSCHSLLSLAESQECLGDLLSSGDLHPEYWDESTRQQCESTATVEDDYGDDVFDYHIPCHSDRDVPITDYDLFSRDSKQFLLGSSRPEWKFSGIRELSGKEAKAQWILVHKEMTTRREGIVPHCHTGSDRSLSEEPAQSVSDTARVRALKALNGRERALDTFLCLCVGQQRLWHSMGKFSVVRNGVEDSVVEPPGMDRYVLIVWNSVVHYSTAIITDLLLHGMPVSQVHYYRLAAHRFDRFYADLYAKERMHFQPGVLREKGSGMFTIVSFYSAAAHIREGKNQQVVEWKREWRRALEEQYGGFMVHASVLPQETKEHEDVLRRQVDPTFRGEAPPPCQGSFHWECVQTLHCRRTG